MGIGRTFGGGGGGAGLKLRTPPDVFTGANRGLAVAARNAGLSAGALAEFDADPNLAIILRIAGADTYQVRRGGAWRDVTNVVRGPTGPQGAAPALASLGVAKATAAGVGVDDTFRSASDDFVVAVAPDAASPRIKLTLPAGKTLAKVYDNGVDITADFAQVAATRVWLSNVDYGPGAIELLVRIS